MFSSLITAYFEYGHCMTIIKPTFYTLIFTVSNKTLQISKKAYETISPHGNFHHQDENYT